MRAIGNRPGLRRAVPRCPSPARPGRHRRCSTSCWRARAWATSRGASWCSARGSRGTPRDGLDPSARASTGSGAPRRRIIFVVESLHVGGTEVQATPDSRRSLPSGATEVSSSRCRAVGHSRPWCADSGVSLEVFDLSRGRRGGPVDVARSLVGLWRALRSWRPDVVQTYAHWPGMFALPMAWVQRVPLRVAAPARCGRRCRSASGPCGGSTRSRSGAPPACSRTPGWLPTTPSGPAGSPRRRCRSSRTASTSRRSGPTSATSHRPG